MNPRTALLCALVLIPLSLPLLTSAATQANCALFARNLKLGMTGDDVQALQVFLNGNILTRVAIEGPGSVGNETMYFGQKTMNAVALFQELYASEVLTPVGLAKGSGFLGTFSRAKIVTLCSAAPLPIVTSKVSTTPSNSGKLTEQLGQLSSTSGAAGALTSLVDLPATTPPVANTPNLSLTGATSTPSEFSLAQSAYVSPTPVIMYTSNTAVLRGGSLSLTGITFTPTGNAVHLDSYVISNVSAEQSGTIQFVVPNDTPYGEHELWVTNVKGESNKKWIVITKPDVLPPTITSFTPVEGFQGTVVTVTGSGFTPTGNQVRITGSVLNDIPSSDGKTLQFTVSVPVAGLGVGQDIPDKDIRQPFGFTIVNENGVSAQSTFYFKV